MRNAFSASASTSTSTCEFFLEVFFCADFLAPKNRSQNELIRKCRVDFRSERNENKFNLSVSYAFHDTDSVAVGARCWRREGEEEEVPWLEAAVFVVAVVVALVTILSGYHCGGQCDTQHHYLPHTDSRHFRCDPPS